MKVLRGKKDPKKGCTLQVVPDNSLCLFWDGDPQPLQRLLVTSKYGMKRSRIESSGTCNSVVQKTGTWTSTT